MRTVWIVGAGGLLGETLTRTLRHEKDIRLFELGRRLSWTDEKNLHLEIEQAVTLFATSVSVENSNWTVIWAAGQGTMHSSKEQMHAEEKILEILLHALSRQDSLSEKQGTIVFSSSAGALYAASTDEVVTEDSSPTPTSAYGESKLHQEGMIRTWAKAGSKRSALVARFSTLYGPHQAKGKKQGLLSHIARCIVRRETVRIVVPLDTMRDYLHVSDAANAMLEQLEVIWREGGVRTAIIASEESTTIAIIIGLFRRITRVAPRVVTSTTGASTYPHRLRLLSHVPQTKPQTSLLVGVGQILLAERARFARGS
jgi:UDP-glucose 4-epimerase